MEFKVFRKALCFDDVLLVPKYSNIESRKKVDISCNLGFTKLDLPIISSPMDTVTEDRMAYAMRQSGGLGIVHRYNSIEEQTQMIRDANLLDPHVGTSKSLMKAGIGAAIGVTGDYLDRAIALSEVGIRLLCIDIAHGHHKLMRDAIHQIKRALPHVHIMAGNVATLDGFNFLADAGADSIKVGIGGGSICSTRIETGHGVATFQSILDCAESDRDALLIADGGIKNSGDIVKALAAGADAVILGSLLAGTTETPGGIKTAPTGERYKSYRGMASKAAQVAWKGNYSSNEGVARNILFKGNVTDILGDLERGIRSGLSYSGCRSVKELQARAKFVMQSSAGIGESKTHIDNKSI